MKCKQVVIESISLHELHPAEWNPRKISDKEKADLKRSLETFGCVEPLVVRSKDNSIVGGHQRYWAALELGWSGMPCVKVKLTDTEARLLNIALNKIHGEWDVDKLAGVIEQLRLDDADISLSGFNEMSLADVGVLPPEGGGLTDPDAVPDPPEMPITKTGDLWLMGEHRLLCGDSTKAEDVERLMDGQKAVLLLTSPPYHVGKEYEQHQSWEEFVLLLDKFVQVAANAMLMDSFAFINFGEAYSHTKLTWTMIWEAFTKAGYTFFDFRVWKRPASFPIYVTTQPRSCGEIEFLHTYISGKPSMEVRDLQISARCLWETGSPRNPKHPAVFPVELPEKAITIYTSKTHRVYDPFLGSGTTLIACEKLNRRCYGMEIDPLYCDVIVKRWEDFTGKKAEGHSRS